MSPAATANRYSGSGSGNCALRVQSERAAAWFRCDRKRALRRVCGYALAVQRVIIRKAGGYDRLELIQEPDPAGAIEVKAIGVNYADCVVRMGLYASAKKYVGWPITPGFDLAGVTVPHGDDGSVLLALRVGQHRVSSAQWKINDVSLRVSGTVGAPSE